jgi:GTP-binding protein
LVLNNAKFEITAVKPAQYPASNVPEVAFVGRSNVGKSSVINSLLSRKNLARVGSTPGKTREINFYDIDGVIHFVDLPGYGFASVSKEKKATWSSMMETYLNTRLQLKLVIMLVDIRHKPSAEDMMMEEWLKSRNMPHFVVVTKSDKVPRGQVKTRISQLRTDLGMSAGTAMIPFSAPANIGKVEIWEQIDNIRAKQDVVNEAEKQACPPASEGSPANPSSPAPH